MKRNSKVHLLAIPLLVGLAMPIAVGAAQAADETTVSVELSSFDFSPETLEFVSGENYVLELTNTSSGGHSFGAKEFFAGAEIHPEDSGIIKKGRIEVPAGQTISVRLKVGAAGTYKLKCTHFLHSGFGMKGEIVVR